MAGPYEIDVDDDPDEGQAVYSKEVQRHLMEIVTHKLDLPMTAVRSMIASKQIDLAPEFQRREIWNRQRKSRLIESLIMGVPIPPVFLGEDELGKYVVLDGRQRLTAIREFLDNEFTLAGLGVWTMLNGKKFSTLEKNTEAPVTQLLMRRTIPAIVVLNESSAEVKFEVFDRLNTGGITALAMEVRNAIYRGSFTELINSCANQENFRNLWGIPIEDDKVGKNSLYSRMTDRELVLRFFALREPEEFKGRLKDHLTKYIHDMNVRYGDDPGLAAVDRAEFEAAVTHAWKLFGDDAFTRPLPDGSRSAKRSFPVADAILQACRTLPSDLNHDAHRSLLRAAFDDEYLKGLDFADSMDSATNARPATIRRIRRCQELFKTALGT